MFRPVHFLNLPVEIVCHVLSFLDIYDLITCSALAKHLQKVISDSSRLQFTIELAKSRMVSVLPPSCAPPYASRLKRLRDRERAWKTLSWSAQHNLKLPPTGSVYEFVGGLYGNGKEDDSRATASISFLELPSTDTVLLEDGLPKLKTWTHPMSDVTIIDFTMDPSQDLLVLVALATTGSGYVYELHLRSLSTNEPHPKAPLPILPCLLKPTHTHHSSGHITAVRVQVSGTLVALLVKEVHDSIGAHLEIWDWINNPHFSCKMARISGIDDFTFLSQDAFLLVRPAGNFEVYSFPNPIVAASIPICQASYGFPPLSHGFMYWYITMSSNPAPGSIPQPNPQIRTTPGAQQAYYPKPDERIHACCLYIFNPASDDTDQRVHCFVFFVNIHALLHPPAEWLKKPQSRYGQSKRRVQLSRSSGSDSDSDAKLQLKPLPYNNSQPFTAAYTSQSLLIQPHPEYLYHPITSSGSSTSMILPLPSHSIQAFALRPAQTPSGLTHPQHEPASIPWSVWGPRSTRWFPECLSTDWQHSIYGLRTIESVTLETPSTPSSLSNASTSAENPIPEQPLTSMFCYSHADADGLTTADGPENPSLIPNFIIQAALESNFPFNTPNETPKQNLATEATADHHGNTLPDGGVGGSNEKEPLIPARHLRLRDYNPYSIMECQEEERQLAKDKKGKNKSSWRAPRVVTEPSTTAVRGVFRHDIISSLPYVEVISEDKFEVTDVMMDDCRLLLLRRGDDGKLRRVDVLTI